MSADLKAFNGRRVSKRFGSKNFTGTISFLGAKEKPYCFKATYTDGDSETMTLPEVVKYLIPATSKKGVPPKTLAPVKRIIKKQVKPAAKVKPTAAVSFVVWRARIDMAESRVKHQTDSIHTTLEAANKRAKGLFEEENLKGSWNKNVSADTFGCAKHTAIRMNAGRWTGEEWTVKVERIAKL